MDPDETLRRLRAAIRDYRDASSVSALDAAADQIAEHVEALDGWLSSGGFLPAAWAADRDPSPARRH